MQHDYEDFSRSDSAKKAELYRKNQEIADYHGQRARAREKLAESKKRMAHMTCSATASQVIETLAEERARLDAPSDYDDDDDEE